MAPLLKPCDTPWRVHALCVVGLWALLPAGPALANELTLDVATRLERIENPDLDPNTDDDATRAILRFNLGLLTETPVATLRFGASVSARQRLDGDGVSDTLSDPRLFFDYTREVAEASFGLSGSVAETDLRVDQEIDDFDDTNGIRRTTQLGTRFSFGDGTPRG